MAAALSGVCAATSTPAEKLCPCPDRTTTEISERASISASADDSSRIIGRSSTFSGGLTRVICAIGGLNARATRGLGVLVLVAVFMSKLQAGAAVELPVRSPAKD